MVFEIENSIIENYPYVKNLSVVKIQNIAHRQFVSAEILKDGEVEEENGEEAESGIGTPAENIDS